MRLPYVVLVAAVALLAVTNAVSLTSDAKQNRPEFSPTTRSFAVEQQHVRTQRFLRTYTTERAVSNEERGINFKAAFGVDKIKTVWTDHKLASYLKKGKDGDNVFLKLKLNKAGESILENPKFLAWEKYVTDYNAKPGNKEISMISTLAKHYDDDVLAKILDRASKSTVADTKLIGSSLQKQQVKFWRDENLYPTDVFARLRLNGKDKLDDILTNPSFYALNRYLVDYNVRKGHSLTMVEVLRRGYGDEALAKMLQQTATNAKDVKTQEMAVRLQVEQFKIWKKIRYNSDTVFKRLGLHEDGVTFENPNFAAWEKYVRNWSGEKTTPFDSLWTKYGENTLATMLVAPREKFGENEVITLLQSQLIQKWLGMIKDPNDVAKMLGTSVWGKTFAASYRWNFRKTFDAAYP